MMQSPALARLFLLGLLLLLPSGLLQATELSPADKRGKKLYFSGLSPSGEPILAYFGEDYIEIPGEFSTCNSCHGYDGLGRPESGVLPSNITWKYLTKSYGHIHPNGAQHPPFDEQSLKEYMLYGDFPGGQEGDPSMPLYDMNEQDLEDLVAYMKHLGTLLDPGLSEDLIRVGTLMPADGRLVEMGQAMSGVIEAYFKDVNQKGGIYGRKLQLVRHTLPSGAQAASEKLKTMFADQDLFALVSTFTPGSDSAVQVALATEDLPLVGPFTLFPLDSFTQSPHTFSLFSGLAEQMQALLVYAAEDLELKAPKIALIYPETASFETVAESVEETCRNRDWQVVARQPFEENAFSATELVQKTRSTGGDIVVFLGTEDQARSFLATATQEEWLPYVMTPGALVGKLVVDAPEAFYSRLHLAYPTMPNDRKDWGIQELSALMQANSLSPSHIQAQISAYASAKILVEALRLSGKDLSRRKFVSVLETFYQFDTGLTPPVTFTRNRRIGARGAHILELSPGLRQENVAPTPAKWIELK